MNKLVGILVAGLVGLLGVPNVGAVGVSCTGSCSINVTATVASALGMTIEVRELINNGTEIGPVVTNMDFGTLASNGTFDPDGAGPLPPQPRALNSLRAYQVFASILNQGRPFTIQQTAGPLQAGPNNLADGSFIVTPLSGIGGDPSLPFPAGLTAGSRGTAASTNKTLFSSSGASAVMAWTYGITDDPTLGSTAPISPNQPSGSYSTVIQITATAT